MPKFSNFILPLIHQQPLPLPSLVVDGIAASGRNPCLWYDHVELLLAVDYSTVQFVDGVQGCTCAPGARLGRASLISTVCY